MPRAEPRATLRPLGAWVFGATRPMALKRLEVQRPPSPPSLPSSCRLAEVDATASAAAAASNSEKAEAEGSAISGEGAESGDAARAQTMVVEPPVDPAIRQREIAARLAEIEEQLKKSS